MATMLWVTKIRHKVTFKKSGKGDVLQQWSYSNTVTSSNDGLTSSHQSENDDSTEHDPHSNTSKCMQSSCVQSKRDTEVTEKTDVPVRKCKGRRKGVLEYLRRKSITTSTWTRRRCGDDDENCDPNLDDNSGASSNGGGSTRRESTHLNDFMGYEIPHHQSPSNTSSSSSRLKVAKPSTGLRRRQQYRQNNFTEILFVPAENLDDDDEEIWHQNVVQVAKSTSIEADELPSSIAQIFFARRVAEGTDIADNDTGVERALSDYNIDDDEVDDQSVANKSVVTTETTVTRVASNKTRIDLSLSPIKRDQQVDDVIPSYTDDIDEDKPSHIFSMIFESAAAAKVTESQMLSEHRPQLLDLDDYDNDDNEQIVVSTCCNFFPFRRRVSQLSSKRFFFAANSTCSDDLQHDKIIALNDTTMDTSHDVDNSAEIDDYGYGYEFPFEEMKSSEIDTMPDSLQYNLYDSSNMYHHEQGFSVDHDTRDLSFGRLSSIITSIIEEEEILQQMERDYSDEEGCDNLDDSEPESSGGWSVGVDSNSLSSEVACLDLDDGSFPGATTSSQTCIVELSERTRDREHRGFIKSGLLGSRRTLASKSILVPSPVVPSAVVPSPTPGTEQLSPALPGSSSLFKDSWEYPFSDSESLGVQLDV